ncbi:hypothetical protein BCT30_05105 [Enterovibrio norvegicus]|uniref:hypothetical protein n=1 Tax=Enterovibrio norvegicus TaxID=188144 RepID=UPI000C8229DD|nr:hypothetical protein [Enterovibrio norvegicus]MCC4800268.1 hypothetical protein [Enterovibrio norvegicus]PMI33551.1 hypothetical protein BCU46_22415 [Enterovibrio norvegicus]PMN44278.1 hypothetical protein BCT30_05105 [Enterovibrio norvegicus]TKF29579.1 hypothetical protein FCV83_20905 [Enterovibrio norvegicus]
MRINKFDIDLLGWTGNLESCLGLFLGLYCYHIAPNTHKKPEECIKFEESLKISNVLNKWQESMARNGETPIFHLFQRKYRDFNVDDFNKLNMEIQKQGLLLAKGQILFRGVCSENDDWTKPVSTTLSPYIAIYHALKNGYMNPIKIYVIEVPDDSNVKAIIGPFGNNVEFGQEYEVLVNFKRRPKVHEEITRGNVTFQLLR